MKFAAINGEKEAQARKVVTLAFLSKRLPATWITDELARLLCAETEASVVVVRLNPHARANGGNGNGEATAVDWALSDMVARGQSPAPRVLKTESGFHLLTLSGASAAASPERVDALISRLSRAFHYILIEAPAVATPAPPLEFLRRSATAYLFLEAGTDDAQRLEVLLEELRPAWLGNGHRFKPVLCLGAGEAIGSFDMAVERAAAPIHAVVRDCPKLTSPEAPAPEPARDGSCRASLRRLAREIGGNLVGLALSSGAAKGFAHVGVIQVLEENGIEVDVVAGVSMGAYVGSLWASGLDGGALEKLARELEGRFSVWGLVDPVFPPRQGFLRGRAIKRRLMRSIAHLRFGDLARPLRVVATNLATLERAVFSSGEVADAVHASIAVPGICVPVTLDGATYIDGGIADPLPVDVLREMGVAKVIAVDAIPTPDRIRQGLQAEQQLERLEELGPGKLLRKVLPLDQQLNYFAKGNLFEILVRSFHGAQVHVAEASCRQADLVLRPDVRDDRWLDWRHPGRFIELGREVAQRRLTELKALVARDEEWSYEKGFGSRTLGAMA